MEPWQAASAFFGILCLLTCMQVRMASTFNMYCIYSLHNLNVQLALLDCDCQFRQCGGKDDTICIAGDCQYQIYRGLKYTQGIG